MSMRLLVNSMPMLKRKPFEATQAPLQKFSFQHRFLRRLVCPWLHLQWQNLYKLFEDFGTSRPEFHFSVQRYCGLEERQVPLSLSIGGFARQPSANFPVPSKFGHSVRTLRPHTCLIFHFVRSGNLARKTVLPTKKLKRLQQKGK